LKKKKNFYDLKNIDDKIYNKIDDVMKIKKDKKIGLRNCYKLENSQI